MSPADFKATRESLHLSLDWLADRWRVHRQSVQRWEKGERPVPDGIAQDLRDLEVEATLTIEEGIADDAITLLVPRANDPSDDGMPAAWHRMIAKRIADSTGAKLLYKD